MPRKRNVNVFSTGINSAFPISISEDVSISLHYIIYCYRVGRSEMTRCSDRRKLTELDPVTFFIITELLHAEEEEEIKQPVNDESPQRPTELIEYVALQVA